jgi:hypothetical protein
MSDKEYPKRERANGDSSKYPAILGAHAGVLIIVTVLVGGGHPRLLLNPLMQKIVEEKKSK